MGIRRLSVTPHSIPSLKEVIRTIDVRQGEEIAAHALSLDLARDVENYLRGELKKICPGFRHVTRAAAWASSFNQVQIGCRPFV